MAETQTITTDNDRYNRLVELIAACYESEEFHLLESLNKKETFMQMMRRDQDEEAHSSLIAKIFASTPSTNFSTDLPVTYLLQLLAKKAQQQAIESKTAIDILFPTELQRNILTNTCSIEVVRVITEDATSGEEKEGRADIVIDCRVHYPNGEDPFLVRIVIENKIGAHEGKGQCKSYYEYYETKNNSVIKKSSNIRYNIFAFLAPYVPPKLTSEHFIKITYTDLLHSVFKLIQLHQHAYDEPFRIALDQYIKTITSPKSNIAMDKEYDELAKKFFRKNEELIGLVIAAVAGDEQKKKFNEAKNKRQKYEVTYRRNGNTYSFHETTAINRLAVQMVDVLAQSGMRASEIEVLFKGVFHKKDFLKTTSKDGWEKVEIEGADYWVETNVWNAEGAHTKKLLRVFDKVDGLSYQII